MTSFFNKLIVKNFGPIKKADIEVKDMMVFIGPQASGKSTLAKLITILNDVNFKQNENIKLLQELEKYNIHSFLKKNTYIEFHTPSFSYKFEDDKEYKFDVFDIINRIEVSKNKIDLISRTIDLMLYGISVDKKEDILFRELQKNETYGFNTKLISLFKNYNNDRNYAKELLKIYDKNINDEKTYINLLDIVKQVFSLIIPLDSLYIPAERTLLPLIMSNLAGLINNKIALPKNILIASQQLEKAFKNIHNLDLGIVGNYKYKLIDGQSYVYHSKTDFVSLNESSSGLQSFLPIILLIENTLKTKNFINLNYVVEEPELNLYPEAQYKLIKYLVKNCLETTREIKTKNLIITTHSPYILASINNLLMANNKSKINPELTRKIIEDYSWIDTNHFNAYEVKKGVVRRIFNKRSKLIEDNIIDEVSEIIMQDFKSLAVINDKSN